MNTLTEIFGKPISVYTRAQAIEDGFLADISETARETGIKFPVAVTSELYEDIANVPANQDFKGRLWDVVYMLYIAIKRMDGSSNRLTYDLYMTVGRKKLYRIDAEVHGGDNGEPVITLKKAKA